MINLLQYREYWERVAARLDSVTDVLPVAVDKDMGKKIQALPTGSVTLFILPPGGESDSKNPDAFREANQCVVFVMEKYDPQRKTAFAALESSQKAIEEIKTLMLKRPRRRVSCHAVRRFDTEHATGNRVFRRLRGLVDRIQNNNLTAWRIYC